MTLNEAIECYKAVKEDLYEKHYICLLSVHNDLERRFVILQPDADPPYHRWYSKTVGIHNDLDAFEQGERPLEYLDELRSSRADSRKWQVLTADELVALCETRMCPTEPTMRWHDDA